MIKRIISLIIVLSMALSLIPLTSFAVIPDDYIDIYPGYSEEVYLGQGEFKYYRFIPSYSGSYVIFSERINDSVDTYVTLYDENGESITYNDDDNGNSQFRLYNHFDEGRVYYFEVRHYYASQSGSFRVSLFDYNDGGIGGGDMPGDYESLLVGANPVEIMESSKWYQVMPDGSGLPYQLNFSGADRPVFCRVYNESMNMMTEGYGEEWNLDFSLNFAPEGSVMYVEVGFVDGGTGYFNIDLFCEGGMGGEGILREGANSVYVSGTATFPYQLNSADGMMSYHIECNAETGPISVTVYDSSYGILGHATGEEWLNNIGVDFIPYTPDGYIEITFPNTYSGNVDIDIMPMGGGMGGEDMPYEYWLDDIGMSCMAYPQWGYANAYFTIHEAGVYSVETMGDTSMLNMTQGINLDHLLKEETRSFYFLEPGEYTLTVNCYYDEYWGQYMPTDFWMQKSPAASMGELTENGVSFSLSDIAAYITYTPSATENVVITEASGLPFTIYDSELCRASHCSDGVANIDVTEGKLYYIIVYYGGDFSFSLGGTVKVSGADISTEDVLGGKNVIITTQDENALVYYSTDNENFKQYTEKFKVDADTTVYAYTQIDSAKSETTSLDVTVSKTANPVVTPEGAYEKGSYVTATTVEGGKIYYKTDGEYTEYTAPIAINSDMDITFYAIGIGTGKSEEITVKYTVVKAKKPSLSEKNVFGGKEITLSTDEENAQIYYTTDGSNPADSETRILYSEPFVVSVNGTSVKACSVKENYASSETYEYTVSLEALKAPVFSISEDNVYINDIIEISCENATEIRYTTDGTEPTRESLLYSEAIIIKEDMEIAAKGFAEGWATSPETRKKYSVYVTAKPEIVKEKDGTRMKISLKSATENAKIYYTLDGTDPSLESPVYSEPFYIENDIEIKAFAVSERRKDSQLLSEKVVVLHTATPTSNYPDGQIKTTDKIILSSNENAKIYYTIDGTQPTESSILYEGPFTISNNTVIIAYAVEDGYLDSYPATFKYTVPVTSQPEVNYDEDTEGGKKVTIGTDTEFAEIYYTLDGSAPTKESLRYEGPFEIKQGVIIRVIAICDGYADSIIIEKDIAIPQASKPVASPENGEYPRGTLITLTAEKGLKIYYGKDGEYTEYIKPIVLERDMDMVAYAVGNGISKSPETKLSYTVSKAKAPVFTEEKIMGGKRIVVKNPEEAGTLKIKINNSEYYDYTAPVDLYDYATVSAYIAIDGVTDSPESVYNVEMQAAATPRTVEQPGEVFKGTKVYLESYNDGEETEIYYTINGDIPDKNSLRYSDGIVIDSAVTIKACAYAMGRPKSDILEASYTLRTAVKPLVQDAKARGGKKITLSTTTPEAYIYYTLDGTDPRTSKNVILYDAPFIVGVSGTVIKAYAKSENYIDSEIAEYTVEIGQLATPVFDKTEDTLYVGDLITITGDEIADIRYTTDGSDPDETSALYKEPLIITDDMVLKAIAVSEGWQTSEIKEKAYAVYVNETPYIVKTKDGNRMKIELKSFSTDATIHYTLDGTTPTRASAVYSEEIVLTKDTTVKAIAVSERRKDSALLDELVLVRHTPDPVANIAGGEVTIGTEIILSGNPEAKIYYTTNGTEPTEESTLYENPIIVNEEITIKAFAVEEGYLNSGVVNLKYTVPKVINPEITFGEDFLGGKSVVITSATENAKIYYTLDGSDPGLNSPVYEEPIRLTETTFVKAFAVLEGYADSDVLGKEMVVPVAELAKSGNYYAYTNKPFGYGFTSHILYYETDPQLTPTLESEIYDPNVIYQDNTYITAFAIDYGYAKSKIRYYGILIKEALVDIKYQYATDKTTVTLSSNIENIQIYYTLDNTNPVTQGILYKEPITITEKTVLRYAGVAEGHKTASYSTTVYVNRADSPTVSFSGLFYNDYPSNIYSITETSKMYLYSRNGLTIKYTTDGTIPDETNGTIYTGAFDVEPGMSVRAYCYGEGYEDSAIIYITLEQLKSFAKLQVTDVENGKKIDIEPCYGRNSAYPENSNVISIRTSRVPYTVYYTLDGTEPTTQSEIYVQADGKGNLLKESEEIFTSKTITIRTLTVIDGCEEKAREDKIVVEKLNQPSFTPVDTNVYKTTFISLETGVEGVSVYYTLDGTEPTSSSTLYEKPFTLKNDAVVKAIAIKRGMASSSIMEAKFNVKQAEAPTFTEEMTASGKLITMSCESPDARIYYTLNGENPTEQSTLYTGPFKLKENTKLSIMAVTDILRESQVVSKLIDVPFAEMSVIGIENTYAAAGGYIEVPIYLQNNPGIAAYAISVDYDDAVLTPVSAENYWGGIFITNIEKGELSGIEEKVSLTWLNPTNCYQDGTVAVIKFKVANGAKGKTDLSLSENGVINSAYEVADVAYIDGTLEIAASALSFNNLLEFNSVSTSTVYTDTKFTMTTEKIDEDSMEVSVWISENSGIGAYDISLAYNNELLTPVKVTNGDLFASDVMSNIIQPNYNPEFISNVEVISINDRDTTENGLLFTVEFDINSPIYPEHSIEFANVQLNKVNGDKIIGIYEDTVIKEEYKIDLNLLTEPVYDETNTINGLNIEINNNSEKTSAVLIVAVFDNYSKRTVNTVVKTVTMKKGVNVIENISIQGANDMKEPYVGIYLWESLDTLLPLATDKEQLISR